MIKKYFYIVFIFLSSACSTLKYTPFKKESSSAEGVIKKYGQWEAKAMIKSLETGEASIVTLDVLAQKPNPIRMEVTTSLGIALASIIVKDDNIEYILPKQKKYFHGPITENAMLPILKVKVDPKILSAAFFEESQPGWDCQADHGVLQNCTSQDGVKLTWDRQDSASRRVNIVSPTFEVQVQVKKFTERDTISSQAMFLKVPENFKRYKLK